MSYVWKYLQLLTWKDLLQDKWKEGNFTLFPKYSLHPGKFSLYFIKSPVPARKLIEPKQLVTLIVDVLEETFSFHLFYWFK